MNVRSAAMGVRSSWLTSARNSRLRSRSSLMMATEVWSRSAISLKAPASSWTSGGEFGGMATRASRWPSARSREVVVRRRSGRASHWASSSAVMSATTRATSAALTRTSVMVRVVCSRDV